MALACLQYAKVSKRDLEKDLLRSKRDLLLPVLPLRNAKVSKETSKQSLDQKRPAITSFASSPAMSDDLLRSTRDLLSSKRDIVIPKVPAMSDDLVRSKKRPTNEKKRPVISDDRDEDEDDEARP